MNSNSTGSFARSRWGANRLLWFMFALWCACVGVPAHAQTVEYIHTDALGSPIAVTNASQQVIERSEYAPYGDLLNRPDTDGPGYTGHVQDAATGMSYMQQRYYDAQLGRFLSVDPIGIGLEGENFNRFWYGANNPYKFKDPDGRYTCDSSTACKAAAAGLGAIKAALNNPNNSEKTNSLLSATLGFYGKAGEANGVMVQAANFTDRTGGDAMTYSKKGEPQGLLTVIRLNVKQSNSDAKILGVGAAKLLGGTMTHEASHGISQRVGDGYTPYRRDEINTGEIRAYTAEAHFYQGARINPYGLLNPGGEINSDAILRGADRSTNSVCEEPGACE
ncbi:RHS repeat domain-containing protein [Pseudoxanthomonas sp. UC19_8]|uniref:RHS repeat domain-containing protein n=1 Tax=Pseudoxanthomonas sp. UC19_8 TaxID=3350175 RepID=UPI0036D32B08